MNLLIAYLIVRYVPIKERLARSVHHLMACMPSYAFTVSRPAKSNQTAHPPPLLPPQTLLWEIVNEIWGISMTHTTPLTPHPQSRYKTQTRDSCVWLLHCSIEQHQHRSAASSCLCAVSLSSFSSSSAWHRLEPSIITQRICVPTHTHTHTIRTSPPSTTPPTPRPYLLKSKLERPFT